MSLVYNAIGLFNFYCSHLFFRDITVINQENIPPEGPTIIYGNHNNQFVDGMVTQPSLSYYKTPSPDKPASSQPKSHSEGSSSDTSSEEPAASQSKDPRISNRKKAKGHSPTSAKANSQANKPSLPNSPKEQPFPSKDPFN